MTSLTHTTEKTYWKLWVIYGSLTFAAGSLEKTQRNSFFLIMCEPWAKQIVSIMIGIRAMNGLLLCSACLSCDWVLFELQLIFCRYIALFRLTYFPSDFIGKKATKLIQSEHFRLLLLSLGEIILKIEEKVWKRTMLLTSKTMKI